MIDVRGIELRLSTIVTADMLRAGGFDEIVIATGIEPRVPELEGISHHKVVSYIDVIKGIKTVGKSVAIMGAGGIGFDVAELISHKGKSASLDIDTFAKEWGVDFKNHPRGGVTGVEPIVEAADREVYLLQRKLTPVGRGLGKTTGWTHRIALARRNVKMINGCDYVKIDDLGLHVRIGDQLQILDVDTVVVCAGQNPLRSLYDELQADGLSVSLVGGAFEASELDAKRAINQACHMASAV